MTFPIYVPSKGRPCATTARVLRDADVPFRLVVEPQEAILYESQHKNVIVLPENDQGIAFVRNWIHEHSLTEGLGWYWMLDDDIEGFFRTEKGKNVRCSAHEALTAAEDYFADLTSCGQAGLEYAQIAWGTGKPGYALLGYCDVAVCIHAERTRELRYQSEMNLKEDRDFTLQVLMAGLATVRVQAYSFQTPKNGSNEGGLSEVYAQSGREREAVRRMIAKWGTEICKPIVKKDGREDVRIDWSWFKRRHGLG